VLFITHHFSFIISPKDASAGVAALNAAVEVVPVVQQAQAEGGVLLRGVDGLARLLLA